MSSAALLRVLTWRQGPLHLLLPAAAVLEVMRRGALEPAAGAPPWVLGSCNWRGLRLPLAVLAGGLRPTDARALVVVCALPHGRGPKALGLLAEHIPTLARPRERDIVPAAPTPLNPLLLTALSWAGQVYAVPDLYALEAELEGVDAAKST